MPAMGVQPVAVPTGEMGTSQEYSTPDGAPLKGDALPKSYVWPENRLPRLDYDEFGDHNIPVIDVGGMDGERRQEIVQAVRQACEEWGFFQIVNHGFSKDLLDRFQSESMKFFSLPLADKLKIARQPGTVTGYGHGGGIHVGCKPWSEAFGMRGVPGPLVSHFAEKVFADKDASESFRECFEEYEVSVRKLAHTLIGLACEGLGVATNHFDQYTKTNDCFFRLNYYTPCPAPQQTMGLGEHSDPSIMTVLHQGNIAGLQVRKNGRWIVVRPQKDAFVVNVGDVFQAVSNGIYKSIWHRAVVNKTRARISIAYLLMSDAETPLLQAPNTGPPVYRTFTLGELFQKKVANQNYTEDTLDSFMVDNPTR